MKKLFDGALQQRKSLQREIIAGITAFFAISYIIIVNPMILADAGIPADSGRGYRRMVSFYCPPQKLL